jgi:hypothetical protein
MSDGKLYGHATERDRAFTLVLNWLARADDEVFLPIIPAKRLYGHMVG